MEKLQLKIVSNFHYRQFRDLIRFHFKRKQAYQFLSILNVQSNYVLQVYQELIFVRMFFLSLKYVIVFSSLSLSS